MGNYIVATSQGERTSNATTGTNQATVHYENSKSSSF
jgi:hypothetical protein